MNRRSWVRWLDYFSANRKTKIANLKWLGVSIIAFVLAMTGAVAQAQPAGKVSRIGFLGTASASALATRLEGFRQGLRELGY